MDLSPGTIELRELVLPALSNHHGTLFAGQGLQLMAKAAYLAARALAQREVVMAGVTRVDFIAPVRVGQQLTLRARVCRVGRSSMTVSVMGQAEEPLIADVDALRGEFELVAIDALGRPTAIDGASHRRRSAASADVV